MFLFILWAALCVDIQSQPWTYWKKAPFPWCQARGENLAYLDQLGRGQGRQIGSPAVIRTLIPGKVHPFHCSIQIVLVPFLVFLQHGAVLFMEFLRVQAKRPRSLATHWTNVLEFGITNIIVTSARVIAQVTFDTGPCAGSKCTLLQI